MSGCLEDKIEQMFSLNSCFTTKPGGFPGEEDCFLSSNNGSSLL